MRKFLSSCITLSILFIFLTKTLHAHPIINEVFPVGSDDWVEIYNPDSEPFDLSRYILRDSSKTNKVTLSGNIPSGGISVFAFGNKLNNGGDIVKLLLVSDNAVIDELSYGKGTRCLAVEGQSIGKSPSKELSIYSQPTKGQKNNDGSPCAVKETEIPVEKKTTPPTPQVIEVLNPTETEKPILGVETSADTPEPSAASSEARPIETPIDIPPIVRSHTLGNAIVILGVICVSIALIGFINIAWKRYNKRHAP